MSNNREENKKKSEKRKDKQKAQYRERLLKKPMLKSIKPIQRSPSPDNLHSKLESTPAYREMCGQMSEYEVRLREQTYKANSLERELLGLRTRLNRDLKRIDHGGKDVEYVEKDYQKLQDNKIKHGHTSKNAEECLRKKITSTEKNAKLVKKGLQAVFNNVSDLRENVQRALIKGQDMKQIAQNERLELQESTQNLQHILDNCQQLTGNSEAAIKAMANTAEIQAAKLAIWRANFEHNFRGKRGKRSENNMVALTQSLDDLNASSDSETTYWWRDWVSGEVSSKIEGLLQDPPDFVMGDSDEELKMKNILPSYQGPMDGVEFYDCVRYVPAPLPHISPKEQYYFSTYRSRSDKIQNCDPDAMDWMPTDRYSPPRKLQKTSDCRSCGQCDICKCSQQFEQLGFQINVDAEAMHKKSLAEKSEKTKYRQEIQQVIREPLPVKDASAVTNTLTRPMIAIGVPKCAQEVAAIDTVLRAFCEDVRQLVQFRGITWFAAIGGLAVLYMMWLQDDDSWLRANNEVPGSVIAKLQEPTVWEAQPIVYLQSKLSELMMGDRVAFG